MRGISKDAIKRFQSRNLPTVQKMRYLGDSIVDAAPDAKGPKTVAGLTEAARMMMNICRHAKTQCDSQGSNILRIWEDPSITDAARVTRSAAVAKRAMESVQQQFAIHGDAALNELVSMRARLAATWAPPTNPGRAALDTELRAALKGMSDSERLTVVKTDPEFRAAAARGHPFLSGLTPATHEALRNEHAAAQEPDLAAQAADLDMAFNAAINAQEALREDLTEITDMETAAVLEGKSTSNLS